MSQAIIPKKERLSCTEKEAELDARIFAHIHLDQRLTGSHLQGTDFQRTTNYVLQSIEFIINSPGMCGIEKEKWERIKNSMEAVRVDFENLSKIDRNIAETQALVKEGLLKTGVTLSSQMLESYIQSIAKNASDILLKTGKVTLPGGWIGDGKSSGHAMIYELTREKDGSLTFIIYNTGAGLDYHLKKSEFRNRYAPVHAFSIPAEFLSGQYLGGTAKSLGIPLKHWEASSKGLDAWYKAKKSFEENLEKISSDNLEKFIGEQLLAPLIKPCCSQLIDKKLEDWEKEKNYNENKIYDGLLFKMMLMGAKPIPPEKITLKTTDA